MIKTKDRLKEDLLVALKKKWGGKGWVVAAGCKKKLMSITPYDVEKFLERIPPPRIRNFSHMAAEVAISRMGNRSGANKFLGASGGFVTKQMKGKG